MGAAISLAGAIAVGTLPALRATEAAAPAPIAVPAWAYPGRGSEPVDSTATAAVLRSVPGSTARFSQAQAGGDYFAPVDWHPETHPAMPPVVAHGRPPDLWACAYCHLPDGGGRPENAAIAGLPAAYIEQQIAAFRDGSRRSAFGPEYVPTRLMRGDATSANAAEVAAAANYFAGLRMPAKLKVVETDRIPAVRVQAFLYAPASSAATEALGDRIIEVADDPERHELHDSGVGYVAYVPAGSIERGRKLATSGPAGPATACFICHGPALQGTPVAPPLAGHFATYTLRQLLAFRTGTRTGPATLLMQPVVARLTLDDMIALAAFAAASPP